MQRIKEFRSCLRLPFPSAEQDACYQALRDTSAYVQPLDCRKYDERYGQFHRAYKKASDICLAIHPHTTPSDMAEFSACVDERMGW